MFPKPSSAARVRESLQLQQTKGECEEQQAARATHVQPALANQPQPWQVIFVAGHAKHSPGKPLSPSLPPFLPLFLITLPTVFK